MSSFDNDQNGSKNFRPMFTGFFNNPLNMKGSHKATWHMVRLMNNQMVRENIFMSEAHYKAATESIKNGETPCQYLIGENSHVLNSEGSGVVYKTGKGFHHVIHEANKPMSQDTEEMLRDSLNPFK